MINDAPYIDYEGIDEDKFEPQLVAALRAAYEAGRAEELDRVLAYVCSDCETVLACPHCARSDAGKGK